MTAVASAKAGVRVQVSAGFVLGAGAKVEERSDEIPPWRGKKCDKQLTHIVCVSVSLGIIMSLFLILNATDRKSHNCIISIFVHNNITKAYFPVPRICG